MYWQNKLLSLLTALLLVSAAGAQRATGLIFDDNAYAAEQRISPSLKFADDSRSSHSLRKYCPIAGDQGNIGSCVGWATAYAGHTISQAVRENITDRVVITQMAKSALYVYNQILLGDCSKGSHMHTAMQLLKEKGVCSMMHFSPDNCTVLPTDAHHRLASAGKIYDYVTLFEVDARPDQKITTTINSLNANRPVMIGMNITASFEKLQPTGLWSPFPNEPHTSGHAMCVVGYDDINQRFEILNSWGTSYGDNGFLYVSYDDYARLCQYGYHLSLPAAPATAAAASSLRGGFYLNRLSHYDNAGGYVFEKVTGQWNGRYYEIAPGTVKETDYFKIMAEQLLENTYLYIFSIKPNGSSELLFPPMSNGSRAVRDAPIIISQNNYVEIPANPTRAIKAEMPGDQYLVCLFSKQRLDDIDELIRQVEQRPEEVFERVQIALGSRMVPLTDIRYAPNQMGFSSTTRSAAYVVPIVVRATIN